MSLDQNAYAESNFSLNSTAAHIFKLENAHSALRFENSFGASSADFWVPTLKDIEKLEKDLPIFIKERQKDRKKLPDNHAYDRQYIGVFVNGKHMIYGNFYPAGRYQKQDTDFALARDGGASYWRVLYNPETSVFEGIYFNGEA